MTAPFHVDPAFCDELRSRLRLSEVIGRSVALKRAGREWSGLCPFHGEKTPSFTVNDAKGFFHCFGCGVHGDVIGFTMRLSGMKFPEAVEALARECGMVAPGVALPKPTPQHIQAQQEARQKLMAERQAAIDLETASAERQRQAARVMWHEARPIWRSPVQDYLVSRGVRSEAMVGFWGVDGLTPMRHAASVWHRESRQELPAMVAPIVAFGIGGADRSMIGIHRTYLKRDGSGKADVSPAKKVLGHVTGGVIRLAKAGEHLVLAEGIETALSFMQATGLPAWAAVSLGNMAGRGDAASQARCPFHPTRVDQKTGRHYRLPTVVPDMETPGIVLPPLVRRLTIAADNDSKDPENARRLIERAASRFGQLGLRVDIAWPPAGSDFNDVLRGHSLEGGGPIRVSAGGAGAFCDVGMREVAR